MEDETWFYFLCLCLFIYLLIFFFFTPKFFKKRNKNHPPTPPSYPIIGHLHLLKVPVHRSLQKLSYTYGPIFSLNFGSYPVIVVSSPQLLEECFAKNDIVFANRPRLLMGKYLGYNYSTLALLPYGPLWRDIRRVSTLEFFSTNRLKSYLNIRKEETMSLVKNLYTVTNLGYRRVELKSRLMELSFNIVMRMATGKRYFGEDVENMEEAERFRGLIKEIFELSGTNHPGDFLKFLQWIDFQGYEKKIVNLHKRSDAFLQSLVEEMRNTRKRESKIEGEKNKTLIDAMLTMQELEPEHYTDDYIKGNILTVILAGTDTSSLTIEWAMSLLLNHPEVLKKAKVEIDSNIGHDHLVDESDLSKLPYLQCILNETLRMFPVAPLLVPHVSHEDCTVGGFVIPSGTMLLANAWAVHRDPNVWDDPTSFKPERFEGAQMEGYKFLPFGMGRRQCPGAGLANRVMSQSLATLIQCFEWKRISEELVDLSEGEGLTMPKQKPLEAMCKPHKQMLNILLEL